MKITSEKKMGYQPSKLRIKIYLFLEKKGLVGPIKKTLGKVRRFREKIGIPSSYVSPEARLRLEQEKLFHCVYHEFIKKIENSMDDSALKCNVIVSGYISTFTKGGNLFFEKLNENIPNINWIIVSQSGEKITEKERNKINFDVLSVPRVPFKDGYDQNVSVTVTEEIKAVIAERRYLQDAIYNIKSYHDDMGYGYAEALVYYTFQYTKGSTPPAPAAIPA